MMNQQKGFAIPIIIAIIALIALGGGAYVYLNNKIETPKIEEKKELSNKEKVEELLSKKFSEPAENTKLTVQKENNDYLVGQTSFGEGGILVMAARVNGDWELVYTGNSFADCDKLYKYNFPTEFLPEYCKKSLLPVEKASGIIKGVVENMTSGKKYIHIDYVTLNLDWKPGGMNGSIYTNESTQIRTFEISNNTKFIVDQNKVITLSEFQNIFTNNNYRSSNLWDIIITGGIVTQITEHYLP